MILWVDEPLMKSVICKYVNINQLVSREQRSNKHQRRLLDDIKRLLKKTSDNTKLVLICGLELVYKALVNGVLTLINAFIAACKSFINPIGR